MLLRVLSHTLNWIKNSFQIFGFVLSGGFVHIGQLIQKRVSINAGHGIVRGDRGIVTIYFSRETMGDKKFELLADVEEGKLVLVMGKWGLNHVNEMVLMVQNYLPVVVIQREV